MGEKWSFQANAEDAVDSGSYELLKPGNYRFTIEDKEDKTTREKGWPMVLLKLRAVEGPSEGTMLHNVVQIPQGEKGHGFMLHFLHAVGLPYDGDVEFDTGEFVGREFYADVKIDDYVAKDGTTKQRNSITRILILEEENASPSNNKEESSEELVQEESIIEEEAPKSVPARATTRSTIESKPVSRPAATTKAANGHKTTAKHPVGSGKKRF